jgi:hypothetical protein
VPKAETEITVVQSHPSAQTLGGLEAWRLGGLEAWRLGGLAVFSIWRGQCS